MDSSEVQVIETDLSAELTIKEHLSDLFGC